MLLVLSSRTSTLSSIKVPLEAIFWLLILLAPVFIDVSTEQHFTLCLFKNIGWDFCPGCGIGRAMAYLYRADLSSSLMSHPFAIPVVLILGHRVFQLIRKANSN